MQVNFYEKAIAVTPIERFGLVDPDDKEGKFPAFLSYDSTVDKWNATVVCNNRCDYNFIPIDNCLNITLMRDGVEETASTCDAMLYTPKTVCFVELKKDKKGGDWLEKAVYQIENTIGFFGEKEMAKYENARAYICNTHRHFIPTIHSNIQQAFYKANGLVLRIKTEIEELK